MMRSANSSVAITQPNFAPWLGYFEMVDRVDVMIHLDDVQYPTSREYVNRNRIRSRNAQGWEWITLSVNHRNQPKKLISETETAPLDVWLPGIRKKLKASYSNAPFYERFAPDVYTLLEKDHQSIADLNIAFIDWCLSLIGITTRTVRSSALDRPGGKDEKLLSLVTAVDGDFYLANNGSKPYIRKDLFLEQGIGFEFQDYTQQPYGEYDPAATPPLSVLDALFTEGADQTLDILRSGRPDNR